MWVYMNCDECGTNLSSARFSIGTRRNRVRDVFFFLNANFLLFFFPRFGTKFC